MNFRLKGKRAIVAGASSGLGLGCAKALAAEGAIVAMGSRTEGRIQAASKEVANSIPIVGDVGSASGATSFIEEAAKELGGVDILITNAGGPPPGTWETIELDQYAKALELNLISTVAMCLSAVGHMRSQKWGRIVAITSKTVRQPASNLILSNTARAGATGFLKTLATDIAADGVTVNSLQPGLHGTDRVEQIYGDNLASAVKDIPAQAMGDPDDFGRVAAFLCSDAASFITGVALPVDGGSIQALQ